MTADRIEAVAQALGVIGPAASDRYRMAQAELAVAALDAYDRGHPTAALATTEAGEES